MEPNKFREARIEIGQVCEHIAVLVANKEGEEAKSDFEKANQLLDTLTPKAEGEIQERSVKNLGLKIKAASMAIEKMKPAKKPRRARTLSPEEIIDWTQERLATLSDNYLGKVFANLGSDEGNIVYFSATGKGVRPSYQIDFGNKKITAFSGSGHKPLKRKLPGGTERISPPFSRSTIEAILNRKQMSL
ncbi:MAG: hypothetical protein L3J69_11160 [Desulfobacula sp.]|nr:hypothetical protein [Desulfobacula sp.]